MSGCAVPRPPRGGRRRRPRGGARGARRRARRRGAELVLDLIGFDERARGAAFASPARATVDRTTLEGKAPGAVARRCGLLGLPCVLFGGRVAPGHPGARALSGDPERAVEDLAALGEELARQV